MNKVTVKLYKTRNGKDLLVMTRVFLTMEEAMKAVEAWENRSPDNYAVYC